MKNRKAETEKVMRTSISLAPQLYRVAHERMRSQGFSTFSDYLACLVRLDSIPRNNQQLSLS